MMNNLEFVDKLIEIAKSKTTYALGGYGQYATPYNKALFKAMYSKNRNSQTISDGIKGADAQTRMYDCNGLVKSTINGSKGYTKSPCPDVNIETMLNDCTDKSTDFSTIEIGEYLVYKDLSHCGIYIGEINGKRYAVECTYRWQNGVQKIDIDCADRKDMWGYHGKLSKYIDYPTDVDLHKAELKTAINPLVDAHKGMQSDYVKAIQYCLVDNGYVFVSPVGYFGDDTENAVKSLQGANHLEATGVVDIDTINILLK